MWVWMVVTVVPLTLLWILYDSLRSRRITNVELANGTCTAPFRDPSIVVIETLVDEKVNELIAIKNNGSMPTEVQPRRSNSLQTDTQVVKNFMEKAAEIERLSKAHRP